MDDLALHGQNFIAAAMFSLFDLDLVSIC